MSGGGLAGYQSISLHQARSGDPEAVSRAAPYPALRASFLLGGTGKTATELSSPRLLHPGEAGPEGRKRARPFGRRISDRAWPPANRDRRDHRSSSNCTISSGDTPGRDQVADRRCRRPDARVIREPASRPALRRAIQPPPAPCWQTGPAPATQPPPHYPLGPSSITAKSIITKDLCTWTASLADRPWVDALQRFGEGGWGATVRAALAADCADTHTTALWMQVVPRIFLI